jgi:hypothetical protein
MTELEKKELENLIEEALERAENIYRKVEPDLIKSIRYLALNESIETDIPGFPLIEEGKPEVSDFIAFILDVRNSTKHLLQACSTSKVEKLERTLYETTAINTMGAFIIKKYAGGITEFLGDGFLAFFKVNEKEDVYYASNAAKECLNDGITLVNSILNRRYNLEKINIGIGLAYSQAIIMLLKINNKYYPKAIGECVYRASKLTNGYNQILFDDHLKLYWPTSKGGTVKFEEVKHKHSNDVKGFKMEKN